MSGPKYLFLINLVDAELNLVHLIRVNYVLNLRRRTTRILIYEQGLYSHDVDVGLGTQKV